MRQTRVGSCQREGSVRQLSHSENTWLQALFKESVEQSSRAGRKSRIASVLPRLIQGLVLLGQMALQQDDTVTACSLLEASAALTKQMEELHLVAQGLSDAQIPEQLVISPRTINWHLSTIYSKLGVSSRAAATRFAIEHRLI